MGIVDDFSTKIMHHSTPNLERIAHALKDRLPAHSAEIDAFNRTNANAVNMDQLLRMLQVTAERDACIKMLELIDRELQHRMRQVGPTRRAFFDVGDEPDRVKYDNRKPQKGGKPQKVSPKKMSRPKRKGSPRKKSPRR